MKVPALMVQGTASHAGKSLLAAGLCRIFLQQGYRVAPFKAQNMSLNSAAVDGGEIGRAQAVQAAACRLPATVDMNPVLLKPTGPRECQVVVQGRPWGRSGAEQYGRYPEAVIRAIRESYERLAGSAEIMVIEGAGSPAEINLLDRDFANMWMAETAGANVLLVGDIERGGVFAALFGTWKLAPQHERIRAFVINKFRGEPALLEPGIRQLRELTEVPTIGVIPYRTPQLPEEDSLGLPLAPASPRRDRRRLSIGVLLLSHIANFTDFEPLVREPGIALEYVGTAAEMAKCDVLILPGTKNTVADLEAMREAGLDRAVRDAALEKRKPVLGICGGYQMLGGAIQDPGGVESPLPEARGLGLLPVRTYFEMGKRVEPVRGVAKDSQIQVEGYFIHQGRVEREGGRPLLRLQRGAQGWELEGCVLGRIWGTAMHGLFDAPGFRRFAVAQWRTWSGKAPAAGESPAAISLDARLDLWAAHLRQHLDLAAVFACAGVKFRRD